MQKKKLSFKVSFKRDLKKHYQVLACAEWVELMMMLMTGQTLPEKYKNHTLKGNYVGYWECHIKPDLLLIYKMDNTEITLVRLGSHRELF